MMWDHVMVRVLAVIKGDTELASIFGDHIRMTGTGAQQTPGLEYMLIADSENELWAPAIFQFDLWTTSAVTARDAERRLRHLFHKDIPQEIGGLMLWTVYTDGSMLATPDRSNYTGRALRFTFTPLREQYANVVG